MLIKYAAKRMQANLRNGLMFSLVGLSFFLWHVFSPLEDTGFVKSSMGGILGVGLALLITYFYERKKQYARLENGVLTKYSGLASKRIVLNAHTEVKRFAGDLIFKHADQELHLNTSYIDAASLKALEQELKIS